MSDIDASSDRIADADAVLIINYGDPAYRHSADSTPALTHSEAIFLRLIAYLAFAEAVCVPARHILVGNEMALAIEWVVPLLEEGLVLPARRADKHSFEDYARRGLSIDQALRRGAFLDRHTAKPYLFQHTHMAAVNKQALDDDLDVNGAFRRVVVGGRFGKYAPGLTAASAEHARAGDGTPDAFVEAVAKHTPGLRGQARRWAMARYYTTPALYGVDCINTREVPASAADLLARGGVLSAFGRTFREAAPVEMAFHRLQTSVAARSISENHRHYCEALLELRRDLPQARRIFADILGASDLQGAGDSVTESFDRELAHQLRSQADGGRMFTLVSSLTTSAAGGALGVVTGGTVGVSLGAGLAFGVASGVVSNEVQQWLMGRKERNRRPWLLAMDRLDEKMLTT